MAALVLVAGCGGGPPHLDVQGPRLEPPAGRVRANALVRAHYDIRNAGEQDLVVHALVPDCGCRLRPAHLTTLAAAATASLTVACRAVPGSGAGVRAIRLLSNDPASPETTLEIPVATADPGADPAALYFGYVRVGDAVERRITLAAGAAEVATPVSHNDAVTVEVEPRGADGTVAYRVRFSPRAPGVLRTMLALGTAAAIPVSGVGFSSLLAFPPEVRLPSIATAGGPPHVVIKYVGPGSIDVRDVELPPGVVGSIRPVVPGRQFVLALHAGVPRATGGAEIIRLHTTAADEPDLIVPVLDTRDPSAEAG